MRSLKVMLRSRRGEAHPAEAPRVVADHLSDQSIQAAKNPERSIDPAITGGSMIPKPPPNRLSSMIGAMGKNQEFSANTRMQGGGTQARQRRQ